MDTRWMFIRHERAEPGHVPDVNIVAYYDVPTTQVQQLVMDQIAQCLQDWALIMFDHLEWRRRDGSQEFWTIAPPPEVETGVTERVTIVVIDPETWLNNQFRDPTEEQGEG